MKIIGITGGVGCGKSTVLSLIEKNYNAYIKRADDVGRQVLLKGMDGYRRVVEIFGEDLLLPDGEIDRNKLAAVVFNNKNKLAVLNSIVHPAVKKLVVEDMARVRCMSAYDYYVFEAALLLDDHYEVFCDETWYIYADYEVRCRRLNGQRGYSCEKTESIVKNQLSDDEFRKRCDKIIDNSGTVEDTLKQIKNLLEQA